MTAPLTDRHAFVIGSNRGIGAAIALRLAQDGAVVCCAARTADAAEGAAAGLRDRGLRAHAVVADLNDRASVDRAIDAGSAAHGPLDILVQCGAVTATTPFLDISESEWEHVIQTNVTGTFHACQSFARHLRDHDRPGSIIVVTSQLAQVALPAKAHYVASKGAMDMLVKAMAVDLAPLRIRVNALAPGVTRTDMAMSRLDQDPSAHAWTLDRIPMGRLAEADEMGGAAAFLASDDASYMTGSTIVVDGGYLSV